MATQKLNKLYNINHYSVNQNSVNQYSVNAVFKKPDKGEHTLWLLLHNVQKQEIRKMVILKSLHMWPNDLW